MVPVGAAAEEEGHVCGDEVPSRQPGELALDRHLAEMVGQAVDLAAEPGGLGHVDEKVVDQGGADGAEHVLPIRVGEGEVTHCLTPLFGRFPHREAKPHIIRDPASVGLLEPRPTALPGGLGPWIRTFRSGWLDLAMVPEWERADIAAGVERRLAGTLRQPDGSWIADYVRLRFSMRKPEG